MNAKDLQKALHILAWIIIWMSGFIIFFLLVSSAFLGPGFILFISVVLVSSLVVLFIFTLEYMVKAIDTITTNSYISSKLLEKLNDEKTLEEEEE